MQGDGGEPVERDIAPAQSTHSIVGALEGRVGDDELDLIVPFAHTFLAHKNLLDPDVRREDIAELTLSACRFLCDRLSAPYSLRVLTPTEGDGWRSNNWIVEVAADDRHSLVDSVCGIIESQEARIEAMICAVFSIEREENGMVQSIAGSNGSGDECLLHIQISGALNPTELEAGLRRCLDGTTKGHGDGDSSRKHIRSLISRLQSGDDDDREIAALLEWLESKNTYWCGYEQSPGTTSVAATGIYAQPTEGISASWQMAETLRFAFFKTAAMDPTDPRSGIDELRIRPSTATGPTSAACRIALRLNPQVHREQTGGIPVARKIISRILTDSPDKDSADVPAIYILDSIPLDIVLGADRADVSKLVETIRAADSQPIFRAHVTPASWGDFCFLTLIAPRQHLARGEADSALRVVRNRLAAAHSARFVDDSLKVARLHCSLHRNSVRVPPETLEEIVVDLRQALTSWRSAPVISTTEPALHKEFSAAPSTGPLKETEVGEPDTPTDDGIEITADPTAPRRFEISATTEKRADDLNQLTRTLDNLGFNILHHASDNGRHHFTVETDDEGKDASICFDTLRAVRAGEAVDDTLGSLGWRAGLGARPITGLRALCALAEHHGHGPRHRLHETLVSTPDCAAALAKYLYVRFDPQHPASDDVHRRHQGEAAHTQYAETVNSVRDPNLRLHLAALGEMASRCVRTSLYSDESKHAHVVALKIEGGTDEGVVSEIFVQGVNFEGLLLRQGRVARAPIHLVNSTAPLRDEVLRDLHKQSIQAGHLVADAGSAGISVIKRHNGNANDDIDHALRSFLDAVLVLTDNVEKGHVVHHRQVVVYDEDDPYLSFLIGDRPSGLSEAAFVAAQERGFWMSDACIARGDRRVASEGAWASIQPTLAAPKDAQAFTAIAIGSPNQLYLPPALRLLAAFDEQEIFINPKATAKHTHKALSDLALQATASWNSFPSEMRGDGATVIPRNIRKLELNNEIASLLQKEATHLTPDEVVRAILALPVDLLWCTQASKIVIVGKGEHSKDTNLISILASECGAKAIAEVGDDLCTHCAREELAESGCIVHGPEYDTLAAALLADRVSNIDLALSLVPSGEQSNQIGTADLAASARRDVIDSARTHSLAISRDVEMAQQDATPFQICARDLSMRFTTPNRKRKETPPSGGRTSTQELDLSRRGVAELRAAAAQSIQSAVRTSSLCRDPYIDAWIDGYFPMQIVERVAAAVAAHPLRHEIAAQAVSRRIVETMGTTFVSNTAHNLNRSPIDVIKAWCAAFIFGGAQEVQAEIEESNLSATGAEEILQRSQLAHILKNALSSATKRLLHLQTTKISLEKQVQRYAGPVGDLLRGWPDRLPPEMRSDYDVSVADTVGLGVSKSVAEHLVRVCHLPDIIDICDLAIQKNSTRATTAKAFLGLEHVFRFSEIEMMIAAAGKSDAHWGTSAAEHWRARLRRSRRQLTGQAISTASMEDDPLEGFLAASSRRVRTIQAILNQTRMAGHTSIAAIEVILASFETTNDS